MIDLEPVCVNCEGDLCTPGVVDDGDQLQDGDVRVSSAESLMIKFSYPLARPTTMEFRSPGGFTVGKLVECVREGYRKIYAEEGEPVRDPDAMLMNRPTTDGPHGIWGHDIGDLVIEGIRETSPGLVELDIGS